MTNKCKVQGSEIVEQCDTAKEADMRGYTDTALLTDPETNQKRYAIAFRIRENHHAKIMNYCPWCGSKITTKYTE